MKTRSVAFFVFLILCCGAVYQLLHYYPALPDTVASHFGASGEADGWSSKRQFAAFYGLILLIVAGSFLGVAILVRVLPTSMINLPHKDHWLALERKEATLAYLGEVMLWIGNATFLLMIFMMQATIEANLDPPAQLGTAFWGALALYMAFVFAAVIALLRRFSKPG